MYKKQMLFQKLICLFTLISGGIVFLYSLGVMTDIYDSLYSAVTIDRVTHEVTKQKVEGARIYADMQPFNDLFLKLSIGFILCAVLLYITNTHVRRRYYISNFISTAIVVGYGSAFSVWAHLNIEKYKNQFLTTVDFEGLKKYAEKWKTLYTDSTLWFDIHYVVFGLIMLLVVLHIINLILKVSLMSGEKKLLAAGKEA